MTLEEIVKHPILQDGTLCKVRLLEDTFSGRVVGQSIQGLIPHYIVECTDGRFPNEVYPYKFLSLPLSELILE